MKPIPEKYLQQLLDAGLRVSEPFPDGHGWEFGVRVGKPKEIAGNCLPDFDGGWVGATEAVSIDGPSLVFCHSDTHWLVILREGTPKPSPGDFEDVWETAEEAIADIFDFYFGNPERMNIKAALRAELLERVRNRES